MSNTFGKKLIIGCSVIALVISTQTAASAASINQWAAEATATSSHFLFMPDQATGAPNAYDCGSGNFWASESGHRVDTLTATFATPVIPTSVDVYQVSTKGGVSKIEVSLDSAVWKTIYTADTSNSTDGTCDPGNIGDILSASAVNIGTKVNQVRITIAQVRRDYSDAFIDAVQLVGSETKTSQGASVVAKTLKINKSLKLPAKSNKSVKITWTSSTKSICTIKSGTLKALKKGTCKISGTAVGTADNLPFLVKKSVTIKK